ncbi:MAG: PorV/PorQ family protein [Candidatus Marinimicrobia bacterium]|nr:PorV/PorQ family protein [Candidatus Neomarinimicrobiota bacterium]
MISHYRLFLIILLLFSAAKGEEKLAQTGFQFLSVATDARAGALGDAMTSLELGAASLYFNPAGMARMDGRFELLANQNQWIADITYNSYAVSFNPSGGRYGVFGLSFVSVDYGDVEGTMVWANERGYIDTEIMHPSAFSAGLGYAKSLTDKFSVGGQIKYAGQQLGKSMTTFGDDSLIVKKNLAFATAVDFGTLYRTGFKSLVFGMTVRNFSNEIKFEKEAFQLPLTFRLGLSMDLMDFMPKVSGHSLLLSVDASHPRSYPEQLMVGLQYGLQETLFLRLGYEGNHDENDISFGFGLSRFGLSFDYAYTPYGVFDNVQRMTLRFTL